MLLAMMRKSAMLLLAVFGFTAFTLAQAQKITGTITDKSGEPLPGVTVTLKGTKTATSTNSAGTFTLNSVPSDAILVLTGVGVVTQEEVVGGRSTISISVATSVGNLNEVVVVGYGTAKRKDLTGAVSSVSAKDFNKGTYTSPDQLIQGKVAGVQMINNSGQPGGASTVKIRGNATITGSGQPLYVVDGVPLDGRSVRPGIGDLGLGGGNPASNPLNFINPNDIASIDILKDASATAIYGSRAAYGVVLITTKKGVSGATKIDFMASSGVAKIANRIKVLDATQFKDALKYYNVSTTNDKGSNVNALDAILRNASVQNYNIAISGGNEGSKYRLSMGYLDQQGIVRKSGIKKYTASLNANFKFLDSKKLGLDVNITPSQYVENIAPITNDAGAAGSIIGQALQWNPTLALKIGDSLVNVGGSSIYNPLGVSEAIDDQSRVTTILASISPYYKFTKWLEYRFLYSINYGTGSRRTSVQPELNLPNSQGKGYAAIGSNELTTQQFTHTLNINKDIASGVNLTAVLGYEYLKFTNKGSSMNVLGPAGGGFGSYGLDFTDYIQYGNPSTRNISSFNDPTSELNSYFGRATVNYKGKYLLTGTFRADGSTKFGANNKYGYFPSFAAGWNIDKESFFNVDFISSLKLRAGWGKTGNQEFPSGSSQEKYTLRSNGAQGRVNNPNLDLKWQADRQYNVGIDVAVLKNRINFTADYFNKLTTDLLYPTFPIQPAPPGSVVTWKNLPGKVENKGFEFSANAAIVDKNDFTIDFNVNATFITNVVSGLAALIPTGALSGQGISGTTSQVIQSGLPINAFFTRHFEGFDKTSGQAIYTDQGLTFFYEGNPNPKTILGLGTTVRYKQLSLTANMNGAFGQKLYNNTLNNVINVGDIAGGRNIALSVYQDPVKEAFSNPVTASSRFIENGSYLKMANATLSYNIGSIGKTVRGASIYLTGQNLFVITKFTGFDPEVNVDKNVNGVPSVGIEYIPYPSARTVTLGVNFSL
ncbi:MAG: SusC/RagA family TonB-linked outer membrane protein [Ferruginibacter sp.]